MGDSAGNDRKSYVDHLKDGSRQYCLIHEPGHSSDECKVLGEFGSKYSKIRPTKYHRHDPAIKNKFKRHQENTGISNHAMHEIILQENKKISAEAEAHVFLFNYCHRDQIACSLLGGFSNTRTAATQSLDSGLCSMLSKLPSCPFIRTRPAPFRPT